MKIFNLIFILCFCLSTLYSCGGGGAEGDASGGDGVENPGGSPDGDSDDPGGSDGGETTSSGGITISGIAQLGPIEGAIVKAYSVGDDGKVDQECSEPATTDENGAFELNIFESCLELDIIVQSSGGVHINESDGSRVENSEDDVIQTFIPEFTNEVAEQLESGGGVGIDPVTDTASKIIIERKQPGISYKDIYDAAVPGLTETFGVRPFGPCSNPNKNSGDINLERDDDKKMFVVAGFNTMIKDNFSGECDELVVEKILTKDMIDFKQDGQIGSGSDAIVISELTNDDFIRMLGDVDCNFDKVREVFGAGAGALMNHIQTGAETFASGKSLSINIQLKAEPEDNPLDMTLFSEYDPKRDRAHADYDPTKDSRNPMYNPINDQNLLGKGTVTIDPKKDPCNPAYDPNDDGSVVYDPAKDFCKLAKEQFKKDLALGITPDPEAVQSFIQDKMDVHYYEDIDGEQVVRNNFKKNVDLVLIRREDVPFEMGQVKMFDNAVIKGKIIQADQLLEKFSDKNQIINMVSNGSDIEFIEEKMAGAPTPLEGAWRSQVCERDGKTFFKEVVRFTGSLVSIEQHPYDDSLCQRPTDTSSWSISKLEELSNQGSIQILDSSKFKYTSLTHIDEVGVAQELYLGYVLDGSTLRIGLPESESDGADSSSPTTAPDCSTAVAGCFTKLDVENPFGFDEQEFAQNEIDEEFKNIENQFSQLDAVYTKSSLVFEASAYSLTKTIFKDDNCKIPEDEFVTTGTYTSSGIDGDFIVDFTEVGEAAPNYFAKILIFDEDPLDGENKWTGVLGDDLFGARGQSADMRADFFNFQKLTNLFTREAGTISDLTGTWVTDCVESYDIYMEYLEPADIGSIGEIDIVNEIVDLVDFYVPPGDDIGPQFGYYDPEEYIDGESRGPDFSNSSEFLFSSPDTQPHNYSVPTVSTTSTVDDFNGVFVGSCESGVGILSFDREGSNGGQVKFDCEGFVIEGKYKTDKILDESGVFQGYYKLDIAGGYTTIKQTVAVLTDGRIAFAKGDCIDEGCGRPPVSDIALSDENYDEYFYKVDNQFGGLNIHNSSSKVWSSSCRCRDDECGASSLYEKMSITFEYVSGAGMRNGGNFSYARTLYIDSACAEESEIQDEEGSGVGEYYLQPEHIITYENGEYVLASYLYFDSNLPLSANSDNCFSYTIEDSGEEVEMFNCEAGLMVLIDGQLMLDEGDNSKQAYYDEQYEFESASEFESEFNEHDGAGGFVFSKIFDGRPYAYPFEVHREKAPQSFSSLDEIDSYFTTHSNEFIFDCDIGRPGQMSGFNCSGSGAMKSCEIYIACEGGDTETYNFDPAVMGKITIDGVSDNSDNYPETYYISQVDGHEDKIYVSQNASLITGSKDGAMLGFEVGDFLALAGTYLSPCLPDFDSMKFAKEKITFNESGSDSIKFSRIIFQDPQCDSPEGVDFQTEGSYIFESGVASYIKEIVLTVDQNMDGKCIDNSNGTFECRPGLLLSAGNYLIPIDAGDDEGGSIDPGTDPGGGGSSLSSMFTSEQLTHFGGDCPGRSSSECPVDFPHCITVEDINKCSDKGVGAYCFAGEDCSSYECDHGAKSCLPPLSP